MALTRISGSIKLSLGTVGSSLIVVAPVDATGAPSYAPFVPSRYRRRLADGALEPDLLLVGATVFGEPSGAALAWLDRRGGASVESVLVTGPYRGQGIGRALVAELERQAAEAGARRIGGVFAPRAPGGEAVSRLVRSLGWSEPAARFRQLEADRRLAGAPLFAREHALRGFDLVAFAELDACGRGELAAAASGLPPALDPLQTPELSLPHASFLLRRSGRIVGWIAAHELAPRAVRWSSLWLSLEVRGAAPVGALLAASFRGAFDAGAERWCGLIHVDNEPMQRLADRRIRPYAIDVLDLYATGRSLEPAAASSGIPLDVLP